MTATVDSTRERILDAALELFAERGFVPTTIEEIEAAAGLTPRAGALFEHFADKEAVLREALEHFVTSTARLSIQALELLPLDDLRSELTVIARMLLGHFRANSRFLRIVQQEQRRFPELVEELYERAVAPAYQVAAEWMQRHDRARGLAISDPESAAAVAIKPFVAYQIEGDLFGAPPAGLETERFVQAWVDLLLGYRGDHGHAEGKP